MGRKRALAMSAIGQKRSVVPDPSWSEPASNAARAIMATARDGVLWIRHLTASVDSSLLRATQPHVRIGTVVHRVIYLSRPKAVRLDAAVALIRCSSRRGILRCSRV